MFNLPGDYDVVKLTATGSILMVLIHLSVNICQSNSIHLQHSDDLFTYSTISNIWNNDANCNNTIIVGLLITLWKRIHYHISLLTPPKNLSTFFCFPTNNLHMYIPTRETWNHVQPFIITTRKRCQLTKKTERKRLIKYHNTMRITPITTLRSPANRKPLIIISRLAWWRCRGTISC